MKPELELGLIENDEKMLKSRLEDSSNVDMCSDIVMESNGNKQSVVSENGDKVHTEVSVPSRKVSGSSDSLVGVMKFMKGR